MRAQQLAYKQSMISYYRFGTGPQPVICFHGYGEKAKSWLFLEPYTRGDYTFIAIDLPFHGDTSWKETTAFNIDDVVAITRQLMAQSTFEKLPLLMGFSLGGRVALSLYESDPSQYAGMVLLAPDGLVVNPWYWLATQTWLGNRLFRFTMQHPRWFFALLKAMNRMRLVNASVYKFVSHYIGDPEFRIQLYSRWTALRKLKPNLAGIKRSIAINKTRVKLLYGKYDRIILPSRGEKFQQGIEPYCELILLNSGHQVLHEKYQQEIVSAMNECSSPTQTLP